MAEPKKTITVRLSEPLLARIKELAEEDRRSRNWMIEELLHLGIRTLETPAYRQD